MAISVGNNINEKQLNDIVSLPVSDNVFIAANYDDLQKNINEITKLSCQPGSTIVKDERSSCHLAMVQLFALRVEMRFCAAKNAKNSKPEGIAMINGNMCV